MRRVAALLLSLLAYGADGFAVTSLRHRPTLSHTHAIAQSSRCTNMATDKEGGSVGFITERAPGLVVCGAIGAFAEATARKTPGLSPLLWATAFGIAIGNTLRAFDPSMKRMEPALVGMKFAKQRLLRAGIILYGAKITFGKILGIGLPGLLTSKLGLMDLAAGAASTATLRRRRRGAQPRLS